MNPTTTYHSCRWNLPPLHFYFWREIRPESLLTAEFVLETWTEKDQKHREDLPAEILWDRKTGSIRYECWYYHGKLHRIDGPVSRDWYSSGAIMHEIWYTEGQWHRQNGPASIGYAESGAILEETWALRGRPVPDFSSILTSTDPVSTTIDYLLKYDRVYVNLAEKLRAGGIIDLSPEIVENIRFFHEIIQN